MTHTAHLYLILQASSLNHHSTVIALQRDAVELCCVNVCSANCEACSTTTGTAAWCAAKSLTLPSSHFAAITSPVLTHQPRASTTQQMRCICTPYPRS
jgi:hypothetical protein